MASISTRNSGFASPGDVHPGDRRRVRTAAPDLPEDLVAGLEGLSLDHVHVPLDDMLQFGAGGLQGSLQIDEDLPDLLPDVAFPDDLSGGVHRVLSADVHRPDGTRYDDNVGECRVDRPGVGVDVTDLSFLRVFHAFPVLPHQGFNR